jgi:transcriptional regulator with PAS, ATPase and Fis domain
MISEGAGSAEDRSRTHHATLTPRMPNDVLTQHDLGIVGRSTQIREILSTIQRVAATDITVLLIGESGVGKEVFARAIHRISPRAEGRMIAINCGAIPETLLESELFGHEKGAFTGAVESRKGLFEAANAGTLFLDEIGEMSLSTQVKLLRVLETLEFTRVGSTEPRTTDVRVVAATNRDLARDVHSGRFREDLYYRLRSACITIPPLRERPEDIPLLFEHFAAQIARQLGTTFPGITPDGMEVLTSYPWPGNVRELRNFVELIITLERDTVITDELVLRHLDVGRRPPKADNPGAIVHLAGRTPEQAERELIYMALIDLRNEVGQIKQVVQRLATGRDGEPQISRPALPPAPVDPVDALARSGDLRLDEMERRMILAALRRFSGNRRLAAEALGIAERTLYRKLKEYALDGETGGDAGGAEGEREGDSDFREMNR